MIKWFEIWFAFTETCYAEVLKKKCLIINVLSNYWYALHLLYQLWHLCISRICFCIYGKNICITKLRWVLSCNWLQKNVSNGPQINKKLWWFLAKFVCSSVLNNYVNWMFSFDFFNITTSFYDNKNVKFNKC